MGLGSFDGPPLPGREPSFPSPKPTLTREQILAILLTAQLQAMLDDERNEGEWR